MESAASSQQADAHAGGFCADTLMLSTGVFRGAGCQMAVGVRVGYTGCRGVSSASDIEG